MTLDFNLVEEKEKKIEELKNRNDRIKLEIEEKKKKILYLKEVLEDLEIDLIILDELILQIENPMYQKIDFIKDSLKGIIGASLFGGILTHDLSITLSFVCMMEAGILFDDYRNRSILMEYDVEKLKRKYKEKSDSFNRLNDQIKRQEEYLKEHQMEYDKNKETLKKEEGELEKIEKDVRELVHVMFEDIKTEPIQESVKVKKIGAKK